ncbi:MAG TPA: hypothetical protein VM029_22005 [Opitutaceae bacterium]|nr:hypothetical protein [Opitutaceae bacterium]
MDGSNRIRPLVLSGMVLVGMFGVLAVAAPAGSASLKVHRTWMPNAYPSAYAIGFPSGLNFCFDPVRGNLIYAWRGDYVDLSATVNGKIPRDAAIRGTMFYQSLTPSGFRTGEAKAAPEIRFRAFRVRENVPEFQYEVDGTLVRESIRPSADGASLVRQFHITTKEQGLTYTADEPVEVLIDSGPAKRAGTSVVLPAHSTVVFTHILPRQ